VGFRILIVEDAQIVREPLCRLLKCEGFDVEAAADGNEAAALLESRPDVDLVLLDVLMPRRDGVAFLEALRRDPRYRRTPVVALTGISDTTKLTRLRELGVSAVVHKVRFTFDGLIDVIRRVLEENSDGGEPICAD